MFCRSKAGLLGLYLLALIKPPGASADPALPVIPNQTFVITNYGAVGDGVTTNTTAIQNAINAASTAGGGTVEIPAGTFLCGPLTMKSSINLQLDSGALLRMLPYDQYPGGIVSPANFINGSSLHDIEISGTGAIDGQGSPWWPGYKTNNRPVMVNFSACNRVWIRDATFSNSPSAHFAIKGRAGNVTIEGVTILAPSSSAPINPDDSPNTDAIDPSACKNVLIAKCVLDVGDDNVALKSGHSVAGRSAACEDITVIDCTFLHGHGMSIGSETVGGVRNLTVRNCTFKDTVSGLRIKSYRGRGGLVENVTYSDIKMTDVKIPINITSYYPKIPKEDTAQPITPETPIYRDIRISNLTATSPQSAGFIVGLPECVVSNLSLENVQISAPTGLTVRNAKEIRVKNVKVEAAKGEPFLLENASVEGHEPAK